MSAPLPALPPAPSGRRIAVLGAGLTGLSAAWHLRRAGAGVTVFEAADRSGGVIGATRDAGWLHEGAPNSMVEADPDVAALIEALGLGPRRLYANPAAKKRYIVRRGRLVAVPSSPLRLLGTSLFSARAKFRLLTEPFRSRSSPAGDESVAAFVTRRLGSEILDYAFDPFVAGVYAGDPRALSLRHAFPSLRRWEEEHGSVLRGAIASQKQRRGGMRRRILSFPSGLEELTSALARDLDAHLRLAHRVTGVARGSTGWTVRVEHLGRASSENFDAVITALPPNAVASLAFEGAPGVSLQSLREIPQPMVVSVFTGFRRQDVKHPLDGFGFLVPSVEGRRILGTLFSSSVFPGRAPEGHVALTTFVGGIRHPALGGADESALQEIVCSELKELLGVRAQPAIFGLRRWPNAIPQYNVGYQKYLDAGSAAEAAAPGLFIGGNFRGGISLTDCLASGLRLARSASAYQPSSPQPK